jgi:hypothetical protein
MTMTTGTSMTSGKHHIEMDKIEQWWSINGHFNWEHYFKVREYRKHNEVNGVFVERITNNNQFNRNGY